jgi:hypothetical protein
VFNNIYESTGVFYFPTPHEVFASGLWSKLSAPAQALYPWLHCLLWDEKEGDKSVMLTTDDIKAGTGIKSTNSVTKAREDLESHGLIRAIRQKGGYIYEPLNPLSKKRLEKIEDFNKTDTEWIQAYFAHHVARLGMFEHREQPGVFMAHCPFHDAKARDKTLVMNTSDGGFWKCIDCERKGKLIQFETAVMERRGTKITPTQARSNVMAIIHEAKREQARIQAEEKRAEEERAALITP